MSGLYGLLNVGDSERVFVNTLGQDVVYDAIGMLVSRHNQEVAAAISTFVEETTENFKERYKLPGGGRMQRVSDLAAPAEVRAYGGWDVAYPLEGYGDAVGGSRIRMAYMTVRDLQRHIDTVMIRNTNTVRFEILRRLFNNTQRTFVDDDHGSLAVESLANGDTIVYPPVIGSESEATENHYYHTGYAATGISDTNNPYSTIVAELEEHFGKPLGGSNIVTFINVAEQPETEALTDFVQVPDNFVRPSALTATPTGLPTNIPGRIIGRVSGAWVSVWDWIPASYILGIHLGAGRPLKMRVDPAFTGLPRGLALVAREEKYPLETAYWEHRFGIGVGNRLNGVFLEFDDSTWDIPTGYTY
jgi:hypothetical protein